MKRDHIGEKNLQQSQDYQEETFDSRVIVRNEHSQTHTVLSPQKEMRDHQNHTAHKKQSGLTSDRSPMMMRDYVQGRRINSSAMKDSSSGT